MNVVAPLNYITITALPDNPYRLKVTTQVRDESFGDNEWHDVVQETLEPKYPLTNKQINPAQRIIIELV
jgi:hypothetical protein